MNTNLLIIYIRNSRDKQYYGVAALLVRCGSYIYNVTSEPNIYYNAK